MQFGVLSAEVVGQGPGGFLLDAEGIEQGLEVHAAAVCGPRQAGAFALV
ncbi:hypothetical protein [Streptomyces anandii]|uniref:Uncharacterized protein n=1 Tax=Streptomyces anandii TaxID=285454 RepID=A0ABW6HC01_9ACTN